MKVLVTGATGTLGHELLPKLVAAGHDVRGLSHRTQGSGKGIEWVRGDLSTGEGIHSAVNGVDAILHAATDVFPGGKVRLRRELVLSRKTEVQGTQHLLAQAREIGAKHFLFVSIVGVGRVPIITYLRRKLEAENLIRESGIPFTIVRLTQFHTLVDSFIRYSVRLPLVAPFARYPMQPIDPGDAAEMVGKFLESGPTGEIVELGGPEVVMSDELLKTWLMKKGLHRRIVRLPLLGRSARALRAGAFTCEDKSGKVTWSEWLRANPESQEERVNR